jgi:bifunctional non-homologous end joining protein LigD
MTSALRFTEPQLASPVDEPPEGKHWIHEIKHDGYRTLLIIEGRQARAYTRNGFDWSGCYPSIIRAAAQLRCKSAIIDGEVIVHGSFRSQPTPSNKGTKLICRASSVGNSLV